MARMFTNDPGDRGSIPVWVIPKTKKKWYLMTPLTLSIVSYGSKVNRVIPPLHLGVVVIEKGAFDFGQPTNQIHLDVHFT